MAASSQHKQKRLKVLSVFGTRPEAIKMAPVVLALAKEGESFESRVCVTAQHRQMLDQVLHLFGIQPDYDLDLMAPNQDLFHITTRVLNGMKDVLDDFSPDVVLVHGDTTTTMATSLAAFYKKIPIGHVEAGLRTWNKYYPFPEEINRVVTDSVTTLYFAPTEGSKSNLLKAGVDSKHIYLTGNTVIDALFYTLKKIEEHQDPSPVSLDSSKRLVLVTMHRRENFGKPLQDICKALKEIVESHDDVEMVIPVHPNPNVRETVHQLLGNLKNVHLIEPLDYEPFCHLMQHAHLILTDSGGIQEEAPSLKKPVLVLRDETERPEAVEMGTVQLVGSDYQRVLTTANRLLDDKVAYDAMAKAVNPYGDGKAAERIVEALKAFTKEK
ncbi:MAG: UDP-N-acetylglucosamine 2-epimerase (non-hydrolyzing) [Vampirovibrionales bacterium]|nr:UDP-N-acetylglucosamine 2-epimerase (non-hydrolyzing) [Vampirovibrionales bacterium]